MRIAFVSQFFDPESGSAAIPGAIARSLTRLGVQVDVLTGFPNYPFGKIYPGYRQRLLERSSIGGMHLRRVPLIPNHSRRAAARSASYLSFALSSSLIGLGSLGKPDCYLVYASPVTSAVGPILARGLSGRPVITYVPDLWPDSVVASGIAGAGPGGRVVQNTLSHLSRWIYMHSDFVIATSKLMQDRLIDRGISPDRITTLYNWVDESALQSDDDPAEVRRSLGIGDEFLVIYSGNLGRLQQVDTFLEAAALLHREDHIRFVFAGSGERQTDMRARARELNLTNTQFLDQLAIHDAALLLRAADVQLVGLANDPQLNMTVPSKLQFGMATRTPAIVAAHGEAARLVDVSGGGITVADSSAETIAQAILDLSKHGRSFASTLGKNGYNYYQEHMSESVGSARLMEIVRRFAQSS